jgi:hypothetical protein
VEIFHFIESKRWKILTIVGLLIFLIGLFFVSSNRLGSNISLSNQYQTPSSLPDESAISGWSYLDRDSMHLGDIVQFTITVLFDTNKVIPDFNIFEKSIDVLPLERMTIKQSQYYLKDDVIKYVIEFNLQAVNVSIDRQYKLDPVLMYYTTPGESDLKSFEIESPSIHIASYYPSNVEGISLKDIKGEITAYTNSSRIFIGAGGIVIIVMVVFAVFMFCARKLPSKLSETERLWLIYQKLDFDTDDTRAWLFSAERIFTQIVSIKLGIKPDRFWSGTIPKDSFWKDIMDQARQLLRKMYQVNDPDKKHIEEFNDLLRLSFTESLTDERRNVLNQATLVQRFINQKKVMILNTGGMIIGILMVVSAVWPGLWVSDIVIRYNSLLELTQSDENINSAAEGFSTLGDEITENKIKAAALYNAATLMSDNLQEINAEQALSIGDSFTNVASDEQIIQDTEDLLFVLTTNIDTYREAELMLRVAIRVNSQDEDIARNLEIIIKRRNIAINIINTLINTGHIQPQQIDELLDLLESQMALEFDMDEGQEAPGYYIGEDF